MGEFVAASAIVGTDAASMRPILAQLIATPSEAEELELEGLDVEALTYAETARGVTVMYPGRFTGYANLSQRLSATLMKPVFAFHIHDGDLWMYEFFADGQLVDLFNPWPRYWTRKFDPPAPAEWAAYAGNIAAHLPGVDRAAIARYLVSWEDDAGERVLEGKAYPEDHFGYGDCWQLLDFIAKLGLELPEPPAEEAFDARFDDRYPSPEDGVRYQKNLATLAWQAKEHAKVVEIYGRLTDLTDIERRRLEYSRKIVGQKPATRRPWWKFW